ncbi:TPA: DUF4400 domain-containing protein [Pseudomonas aeruginosa]|nr:DUF4400 domain-containing protein [Pseudomonas aeruginosa]
MVVLPWIICLALPVSVYLLLILSPSPSLLGFAMVLTASSFKKYL